MKNQKGITLIALIITIVILLILAVVAISAVTNQEILLKSQEATKMHTVKEEEEKLELEINEWVVLKYSQQGATDLGTFLAEKYDNVETVSEGTYTVTTENGNQFTVTEDGATYIGETDGEDSGEIEDSNVPTEPSTPVTPEVNMISFTLDGTSYSVPEGTTWNDWVNVLKTAPSDISVNDGHVIAGTYGYDDYGVATHTWVGFYLYPEEDWHLNEFGHGEGGVYACIGTDVLRVNEKYYRDFNDGWYE